MTAALPVAKLLWIRMVEQRHTEEEHFRVKTRLKLIGRRHMLLDTLQKI